MSHMLDHQAMDARDVASILDNLADATTEPPTFRHRKFTIETIFFSFDTNQVDFIFRNSFNNMTMRCTAGK